MFNLLLIIYFVYDNTIVYTTINDTITKPKYINNNIIYWYNESYINWVNHINNNIKDNNLIKKDVKSILDLINFNNLNWNKSNSLQSDLIKSSFQSEANILASQYVYDLNHFNHLNISHIYHVNSPIYDFSSSFSSSPTEIIISPIYDQFNFYTLYSNSPDFNSLDSNLPFQESSSNDDSS